MYEQAKYAALRRYLHDQMLLSEQTQPLAVDGNKRLDIMQESDIQIDYISTEGVLEGFLEDNDFDGVKKLHGMVVQSDELLGRTTQVLYREALREEKRKFRRGEERKDPVDIFQQKAERILQAPSTALTGNVFTHTIIGLGKDSSFVEGEILPGSKFDQLQAMEERVIFRGEQTRPSDLRDSTLRQLTEEGLLDLQSEEHIEEWIIKKAPGLNNYDKGLVRRTRREWLAMREERANRYNRESYQGKEPSVIIELVTKLCMERNLDRAYEYMQRLPIEKQINAKVFETVIDNYIYQARQDDAIIALDQARTDIPKQIKDKDKRKDLYSKLVLPHAVAADAGGLDELFTGISRKGYQQMSDDLGLANEDVIDLFLLAHFDSVQKKRERERGHVTSFTYTEIRDLGERFATLDPIDVQHLLDNDYRKRQFTNKYGYINTDAVLYGTLLCERIVTHGKDRMVFPQSDIYQADSYIVHTLLDKYGQKGNEAEFRRWLKIMRQQTKFDPTDAAVVFENLKRK